jgi:transposase-like protein
MIGLLWKGTAVDKKTKKKDEGQGARAQMLLPVLGLLVTLKGDLLDLVVRSGLQVLGALLEQERTLLCGPRYQHQPERRAQRSGYAKAELPLGGRRVSIARPRVRDVDGEEVRLPSWEQFAKDDPLTERAVEQMLIGVATRKYARSLEPLPEEVNGRGTSKSAVSRRFVEATAEKLSVEWSRSLTELSLSALMIDGIVCGEHTVLVTIGIDEKGNKHVLGLAEGATENASACTRLLTNLVARGLNTTRSIVVVIDGSKALAKAVRSVFGSRALIQRCQVHKKRNVLESLPEQMKSSVGAMMTTAYQCRDPKKAIGMLQKIARQLEHHHPGAAESLREGLEETVTITAAQLCDPLARTLATTNPIENINSAIRRTTRNVKRWQGGTMVLRWVGAALHEAAKGFHRLKGHAGMPKLVAFLRANDERLDNEVAAKKKAA